MVLLMIILDYFARPQNATWSHNKNKVWNWLTETMYVLHIRLLVIIRISCSDYKRKTFLYPTKVKYLVSFLTWIMSKNETYQSSNVPKSKLKNHWNARRPSIKIPYQERVYKKIQNDENFSQNMCRVMPVVYRFRVGIGLDGHFLCIVFLNDWAC